jgi:hypothetical protein
MHAVTELEDAVDKLHAVPLEDFVEERKRLAKELRAAGDRAAAAELAKLAKPSAPAWALNHLAREEPGTIGDWLAAAETLRDASERADRSSADALRSAIAAHRDATRALLATVRDKARPNGRELSEQMVDRVRDLLQAATADPDAAERLRAGLVVEGGDEPEPVGLVAEDGDQPEPAGRREREPTRAGAARARAKSRAAGGDEVRAAAEARAAKEREAREAAEQAELERLVAEAEERLGALRAAAEEAEEASARADERLEEAERTLHRSESEATAARAAASEAAEAAEQAERELRTLTAKLSS